MKSVKYLLDLQERKNLSDTALASLLGVSQPAISQYKHARRIMDDETCLSVALHLGIEPMEILGAVFLDRAEKAGQRSVWEVFMNRAAMTAGAALVATSVNFFLTPTPANAASMRVPAGNDFTSYRLCEIGRRRKSRDTSRKNTVPAWLKRMFDPAALEPAAR